MSYLQSYRYTIRRGFSFLLVALLCVMCNTPRGGQRGGAPSLNDSSKVENKIGETSREDSLSDPRLKESLESTMPKDTLQIDTQLTMDQVSKGWQPRYRLDLPPYNTFVDQEGFLDFSNVSATKIQSVLGDAPVIIRIARPGATLRREIRVYFPYEEDPTGLFLFLRNETVVSFRLDEFNGLSSPQIQDFFNK